MTSWLDLAAVLDTAAPEDKTAAALMPGALRLELADWTPPPTRPARPALPVLISPHRTPRRRLGSERGRVALIHALAHIEFNAIDLAFDMALRFAPAVEALGLDWRAFVSEWSGVGAEEASHFSALSGRLAEMGSAYGALPAHDGLWETAARTADDVLARLALAPLVLEARGLDVTPKLMVDLRAVGDVPTAGILERIYQDEIGHVAVGARWFDAVAGVRKLDPAAAFRRLVEERFRSPLKPPFNESARTLAGLRREFYDPTPAAHDAVR